MIIRQKFGGTDEQKGAYNRNGHEHSHKVDHIKLLSYFYLSEKTQSASVHMPVIPPDPYLYSG